MREMEASSPTQESFIDAAALYACNIDVSEALQALQDDDWEVRAAAAVELETIGAEAVDAVPELIQALESDKTEEVRRAAAEALGSIGPAAQEAVPVLAQALSDESVYMRWAVTKALKAITEGD
jgi:3-methyladenine DNA glycosylase AlkD